MTLIHRFCALVIVSLLTAAAPAADQTPAQGPATQRPTSAQQPASGQQPPEAQQPTFQSGTQVVQVDVRVFDKDGHFVTDLAPGDFEVKEDGIPQQVGALTLIGANPSSNAPSTEHRAPSTEHPAPSTEHQAPSTPSTWLFVFDTTHLSPPGLQRTQKAVEEFLQSKFHDGDLGGIVFEGKMANNRLTTVREELVKAVGDMRLPSDIISYQNTMRREWPRIQDEFEAWRIADQNDKDALQQAIIRACSDEPDRCKQAPPDVEIQDKSRQIMTAADTATALTLRVVEVLCNGLARMAGPKTVVFFSEGFLTLKATAALQHATGMANRAGAHFYTIDARGLNKGSASSSIIDEPYAFDSAGPSVRMDLQEDGTNSLAVDTGGLAIRNENNFGKALDTIQRDAGTYYVLGYTPTNQKFDGKYRAISVSVNRPGVKVRARRGYLAIEPAKLLKPVPITTAPAAKSTSTGPASAAPAVTGGALAPEGAPGATSISAAPVAPAAELPSAATTGASASTSVPDPTAASATSLRKRIESKGLVEELQHSTERLAPTKASDAAGKGWAAYEKGDVEGAVHYLGEAARSSDAHPWVRYALGLAHLALQQYPDAVTQWEQVRHEAPDFEPVYFNLADGYMLQKDDATALKVLRDAEQRWPRDAEIYNAMGVLQIRRGALDSAVDSFAHATSVAPQDGLAYFNLGRAYQMRAVKSQRYDSARERWVGGEADTKNAVAAFDKYVRIGGPFVQQAKEALQVLAWK
ncbi:MAG TPA: VWA domain-containing protein [Vicinamibacterales bacterium]|nr:VWA domain-containing protein [Vicinamibacterales bacterium]